MKRTREPELRKKFRDPYGGQATADTSSSRHEFARSAVGWPRASIGRITGQDRAPCRIGRSHSLGFATCCSSSPPRSSPSDSAPHRRGSMSTPRRLRPRAPCRSPLRQARTRRNPREDACRRHRACGPRPTASRPSSQPRLHPEPGPEGARRAAGSPAKEPGARGPALPAIHTTGGRTFWTRLVDAPPKLDWDIRRRHNGRRQSQHLSPAVRGLS